MHTKNDVSVISGEAVLNYLKSRNSQVDFMRDTLDVIIETDGVAVRIVDKVSGGKSTHKTAYSPVEFEEAFGSSQSDKSKNKLFAVNNHRDMMLVVVATDQVQAEDILRDHTLARSSSVIEIGTAVAHLEMGIVDQDSDIFYS